MTYNELYNQIKEEYEVQDDKILYLFKYYLNLDEKDRVNNKILDKKTVASVINKVKQLKKDIPIQYVVGNVEFYGYNFNIEQGVLIPRFETEQLVYHTKKYIEKYLRKEISVIDVGTGSGVIGLSLKKEIPNIKLTLVDISEDALKVSLSNSKKLNIDAEIYKSDMLEEVIKKGEKFDVLISNPPYLTNEEEIMEIVKKNEPSDALYGGKDGLKYYRILLSDAKKILKDKAIIAFEIGANQAQDIIEVANYYFEGYQYEIKKDLQGRDRMFFLFYNLDV